jgi:hypothetical protein
VLVSLVATLGAVGQAYIITEMTDLTELTDWRPSCTIVAGSTWSYSRHREDENEIRRARSC